MKESDTLNYLHQTFKHPFPKVKFKYTSTQDTKKYMDIMEFR
jgi:hypothetical protein